MSKIKLLLGVIEDIRSLSVSLQALADAIITNEEQKETLHSEKLEKKLLPSKKFVRYWLINPATVTRLRSKLSCRNTVQISCRKCQNGFCRD